ncbi:MAG: response regulator [Planctomycetaceae bacterium]
MKDDKLGPDRSLADPPFRLAHLEEAFFRLKVIEEELLRRDERSQRLMEISRVIGSTLNIDEVYERFARVVKTLIHFDRISVTLIKPQEYTFTHAYVSGTDVPGRQVGTVIPLAGSGAEDVFRSGSPLWVREENRAEVAARFPALAPLFEAGFRSTLLVPLISENQVIGILNISAQQPDAYSSSDISLAEGIAAQIAGAIANSQLYAGVRQAEEALRASEEKYRTLVENASEAIFILQDEKIKFANSRAILLSGYTSEELSRTPFMELIHPEDREMALEQYGRKMKGEEIPRPPAYRYLNKSGETLWVQMNSVPITWQGCPATLYFARDLTQEKKLEAQFQMAQKMEAIGTLAGGIAHDFNNLLMGIQGHISLMLFDLDSSHPHYESLKKIEEQVKSGANLASQLLAFARRGKYEVKSSDLNQIVQQSSGMFERTKKEVKVFRKYQEKIWPVEVDRNQIEQILLNLYVNAWQAMQEGGNLYLETQNIALGPDYSKPFAVQPGRYVRISVRDTGVGMDKKTATRIFEPFFTTKEMGRGTGLGLASVYGIVKNHGGFITVYSEVGHGTTFHIYLPASEKEITEEKKLPGEILAGKETILLVDDEETIIEVMEKALLLTGYKVFVARGGEEALEVFKKNRERIDIVILDMIMPGMGGGKVFDSLRALHPGVKVVLSSGYSIDGEASQIMARGCNGFIQKPFGIRELSQKIREVMGKG